MELNQFDGVTIIKRDNRTAPFQGEKIALAIKKGFDSVYNDNYSEKDINHVYQDVLETLVKDCLDDQQRIRIEDIQDTIEKSLIQNGYQDVFTSFSSYRSRRSESRHIFLSKQHKFLKAIEQLNQKEANEDDSKRENANIDGNSAMGMMLQFGSTVSKEYAKAYLMSPAFSDAHDSGQIHIHDMDFLPMGTTTCCQIDLGALFAKGFSTGHGYLRSPRDISSFAALAAIAIQSNQNDQHGGQSIPAFDFYMAPGVLNTFKKHFKQHLYDFLELDGYLSFVDTDKLFKDIDRLSTFDVNLNRFESYTHHEARVQSILQSAYSKAIEKTNRLTYQAMEGFIHNLNTMHSRAGAQVPFSSVNFGTDTSSEGRMVIKNFLLAADAGLGKGETPIFPISIFKVKDGVNYNEGDPNHDLFKLACQVSAKRLFPNFSFLDAPFNLQYYKEDDYTTEATYMGCRTRVISDVTSDKQVVNGRGNLSFTSINLVRIGLKHGERLNASLDLAGFYSELDELMDLVKDQLLERFKYQCSKSVINFPFLLGQGVWMDSKTLKPKDNLRKVLKHGTLTIGFIGLAETLKALIGKHHGESEEAQRLGLEIITHMRQQCDLYAEQYKLNFSLIATPAEGLSGRFVNIDKAIYGYLEGITDLDFYTNSFHIPVYFPISANDKIALEAPYHELTNGGHISYIEMDGDPTTNLEAFEEVIAMMHDSGIGYGAINHPVDRDPVCGYTGIINDLCPGCGRDTREGPGVERIRRITGYLVGTLDRFNDAKRDEERHRVKHSL